MGQQQSRNSRDRDPLPPQSSPRNRFKILAVCCFLLLAVLLVYVQTTQHEFIVCDDQPYVYGNPHVINGFAAKTWKGWLDNPLWWCLTTDHAGNWHPLTWLSHVIDGQLYGVHGAHLNGVQLPEPWKGPEAGGHHLTSVLLHAAAAIVLFLALQRMTAAFGVLASVAAMFSLHPLRAESVAWVAERKDVLSGLFWMLTLFAYGGYALRPSIGRYLAVVAMFALGLTAKSMLVTLPCVLLLLDFWPLRRWQPKRLASTPTEQPPSRFAPQPLGWLVLEKLPLFALSLAVCLGIMKIQEDMGCMTMTDTVPMDSRVANAAFSSVAYLGKMIWPLDLHQSYEKGAIVCNLAIFYPHLAVMGADASEKLANHSLLTRYGIGAAILLIAITLLVLWNLRRRPYLAVGWFWYLGTLVPVIGLIQVGAQGMADRYTYLPMIGIAIMLVWGGAELAARFSRLRMPLGVAAGILLATWTTLSFVQVATWRTSETVFQHAVDVISGNYFAYNHLGLAFQNAVDPTHRPLNDADQANLRGAKHAFEEAVRFGPSYDAANANLGAFYMNNAPRQLDKAVVCFENAVRVNPHGAFHHANLGHAYMSQGKFDKAAAAFSDALEIEGDSIGYRFYLATALLRQGKAAQALAEYRKILRLQSDNAGAMTEIAWCLATNPDPKIRDGKEALELAQQAMHLTGGNSLVVIHALAAAYAEAGQYEQAAEAASEARKIAIQARNKFWLDATTDELRTYESGAPFRQKQPSPASGIPPTP